MPNSFNQASSNPSSETLETNGLCGTQSVCPSMGRTAVETVWEEILQIWRKYPAGSAFVSNDELNFSCQNAWTTK